MRLLVQRVKACKLYIDGEVYSAIGPGLCVLIGIETEDTGADIEYLCHKLLNLRIFNDAAHKMNLDVKQTNGEIMVVSQFTLHASTKKGNRPSYLKAAQPDKAIPLYENFIQQISILFNKPVKTGKFGAEMDIELVNAGPVTIWLDSKNKE